MSTYSSAELRALTVSHPPSCCLWKILFTFHLWWLALHRRSPVGKVPTLRPSCDAGKVQHRSADGTITIGWLNTQSLGNKSDRILQCGSEQSFDVLALTETWHISCRRSAVCRWAVSMRMAVCQPWPLTSSTHRQSALPPDACRCQH